MFNKIVLTGDRPTGALHLGHYVGSLKNRVALQESGEYNQCFYMVADVQALTDNADNPEKVRNNLLEVVKDNLAVGVDPNKTHMFVQSMIPEIAELTVYFMNLVTAQQLSHNPTIKTEAQQKGYSLSMRFGEEKSQNDSSSQGIPMGFLAYPVSQAADILFAKATHIPVGADQIPVIETTRDVARKFNATYGAEVFPLSQPVLSSVTRLVGTDGNAKASKSLGNAIYLKDSPEEIERKVMGMYTDPNRIRKTDPGQIEGNVVFSYLDIFDPRTSEIEELKARYQAGGEGAPGDVEIKKRLVEVLRNTLDPIRAKREELDKDPQYLKDVLQKGILVAREHAAQTMDEVRRAMKIDYFS